jgi:DNA-binding LacI/PurR family transcriptional regulator
MNPDSDIPRVSLRDIAARLGVSHSTVSLSLRDHPRISRAVKERVRQAAGDMGYRPDPLLAALANYRRHKENQRIAAAVAWINGWRNPESLRQHQEFDGYWQGAFKAAERSGFRLEEFRLGSECGPQRLHQLLSARGIRGILLPPHPVEPDWQDFPWDEYSIVRFERSLQSPECHIVTADLIANTLLAVRKIRDRGYRRIGFVMLDGDSSKRGMPFELGFLGGQRLIHDEDPLPVLVLDHSKAAGGFCDWLSRHQPDAIFTPDPAVAGLLDQSGLRVPQDIGLAVASVFDGGAEAGIDPHPEEIGRLGFLMLNSLINDRARGIPEVFSQTLVAGTWVDGASLPDRNVSNNHIGAKADA